MEIIIIFYKCRTCITTEQQLPGQTFNPNPSMMFNMHKNKWLELVYYKCKNFLSAMDKDYKADNILELPFKFIYQTVSEIYK